MLNHYGCYGKGRQAPSGKYYCISKAGADLGFSNEKTVKIFVWIFTEFYFFFVGAFNLNHDCSQIHKNGQSANDYTGLSLAYIKSQQDYDDWKFLRGT